MRVLVHNDKDDFRVKAYAGTNGVLLAMDLDASRRRGLLGFAIEKQTGSKPWLFLFNSLTFPGKTHTFPQYNATPSNQAPLQKFRWADYAVNPGATSTIGCTWSMAAPPRRSWEKCCSYASPPTTASLPGSG